jgi:Kyakuja-Dileera-Zisupton transposase
VFRAISDRNRFNKGYDATGIGAITCARHGAMVPASVVDFQKGERQMNMDYSLCQTVKVVVDGGIKRLVYFYDISCSYCVNLGDRIAKSDGRLSLPEALEIIFGIGQFHVHGHQETCFGRFSPVFIEGIGWVSGEIVESNWSLINPVGLTCTTMTAAHRYEVLDAKMLDLNWKKMTHLGMKALTNVMFAHMPCQLTVSRTRTSERTANSGMPKPHSLY